MIRKLMPLLALPLLAGAAPPEPQAFAGHFTVSWESISFRPCGAREAMWVADAGELGARYRDALGGSEYGTVFARIKGEVSEAGQFGHMGQYRRMLAVKELVEVRPKADDDCRPRPTAE